MKKPEKKEICGHSCCEDESFELGYNQACDDWQEYHEQETKKHQEWFNKAIADTKAEFLEELKKIPYNHQPDTQNAIDQLIERMKGDKYGTINN